LILIFKTILSIVLRCHKLITESRISILRHYLIRIVSMSHDDFPVYIMGHLCPSLIRITSTST